MLESTSSTRIRLDEPATDNILDALVFLIHRSIAGPYLTQRNFSSGDSMHAERTVGRYSDIQYRRSAVAVNFVCPRADLLPMLINNLEVPL